jgi:hypothetical protein
VLAYRVLFIPSLSSESTDIVAKAASANELNELVGNDEVVVSIMHARSSRIFKLTQMQLIIGLLNAIAGLVDVIATFSLFRILTFSRTGFAR